MQKQVEQQTWHGLDKGKLILMILIAALCITASVISDRFASLDNVISLLRQNAAIGILAVGMTFVILTGGIDLSAGYGVTMGAIVTGLVFLQTGSSALGIAAGIGACMLLGLVNGLLVTCLHIMPFIATLATMSLTQGVLNLIAAGIKIQLKDPLFNAIGMGFAGFLPVSSWLMFAVFLCGVLTLRHTTLGSYVYAIGSNEKNTRLAGIRTGIYKTAAYTASGVCMGIASVVMGSRIVQVTQESGGNAMLMDCIMAVIIGGTSIEGGKGDIGGTLLGVVFAGIVGSMLVFLSIPSIAQDFFKGIIIIVALFLNLLSKKARGARKPALQAG